MKVHALFLYPVKSLAGIPVDRFSLDDFGPVGDRRWMIVGANGQFVTQRLNPELAMIATRFDGPDVIITIPGEGEFRLSAEAGAGTGLARVWRDQVDVLSGPINAADALSRFCGKDLHFVYMRNETFRRVDPEWVPAYRRVSFADGFPFLVTNQASLDELNSRLEHPVDMRRFRPNLVVSGAQPWDEDRWTSLSVREISLSLVKPCSRCIMTTVDPDTGIRSPDGQPLKTLASYRRAPDGVIFGLNGVHDANGTLSVGDPVSFA